ncbi:hypothetical protein AC1031_000048 [Aphanomyces cochlioides]|nr:hypothetical protein AC1031_000048 [Aphanomyces cochlioides]
MNKIETASFGVEIPLPYELLHHAFEEQTKKCPDLPAIEYNGASLTYSELDSYANTLASQMTEYGAVVGSRIAIIMERCLEFPLGLLATLKTGAAMLPLDASFPISRLSYILEDAKPGLVITTEDQRGRMESLQDEFDVHVLYTSVSSLSQNLQTFRPAQVNIASKKDEAYIVYTSGSTGKPKGVPVTHDVAVNVMTLNSHELGIVQGVRLLQFMAIGFDVCQWEVWSSLSVGATLVLRSESVFDSLSTVDGLMCTPTALSLLGSPSNFPNLKFVVVTGEATSLPLKDLWAPFVKMSNGYGLSECFVTHISHLKPEDRVVPIGCPIQNVNCYILDSEMRVVPTGCIGELYLGGICPSPGYINLPKLTEEHFMNDPFSKNDGRMYRTGDLGRLLHNGVVEVLGRKDSQVKLKGYRIELEEISNVTCIIEHPHITSAAVIVKDKSHLVAYYTPKWIDPENYVG